MLTELQMQRDDTTLTHPNKAPSAGDPNNLAICVVSQIEDAPLVSPAISWQGSEETPGPLLDGDDTPVEEETGRRRDPCCSAHPCPSNSSLGRTNSPSYRRLTLASRNQRRIS